MSTKGKKHTLLYPLVEAIAQDARNKRALEKQFESFYKQMKAATKSDKKLKDLDVPLEKVKASVVLAAFGRFFGIPMVTLVKPKKRKG